MNITKKDIYIKNQYLGWMDANNYNAVWHAEKTVGNGGRSGILYVPKMYAGYDAKVIIPNNGTDDVITKTISRGSCSGYMYVHKKHLGKTVRIMVLPRSE